MKCPHCSNELRKEDFDMLRLHPTEPGHVILECVYCKAEITATHAIVLVPVGVYRRAEDQIRRTK